MKNFGLATLLLVPFFLKAQSDTFTGVSFAKLADWNSVIAKAKQENKIIFVDFYTTWCGPCKKMEKEVYTVDSVGYFFGEHFLSIKVQLDSSKNDDQQVKNWYADAKRLQHEYKIGVFPSFLFFSPEGKLLHKGIGYQPAPRFIQLAHNALDPKKQLFTRMKAFRQGKLPYTDLPDLAFSAKFLQETEMSVEVSKSYIDNYLLHLPEKELYTSENLGFIATFLPSTNDKAFKIFYAHGQKVDSLMKRKDLSRNIVEYLVEKEEVNTYLYKNAESFEFKTTKPNWDEIEHRIKTKYNSDYADRIILWAKIKWAERHKDWPEYCEYVVVKVEKYGPYDKASPYSPAAPELMLNNCAWEIFAHSTDPTELGKALEWSAKAVKINPTPASAASYLDTYANILYKLGRKEEAISSEEKALSLSATSFDPGGTKTMVEETLNKIKKGEPTWTDN